jgi:hypothetical protein
MTHIRLKLALVLPLGLSTAKALGNAVGGDFQTFNPNYSTLDFLSVEPARTLSPGQVALGGFLDIGTNVVPTIETRDKKASRTNIDDTLLSSHAQVGYGLLKNLEIGAAFPMVLSQSNSSSNYRGEITKSGMSYFRFGGKYTFLSNGSFNLAGMLDMGKGLMKDNPYQGQDGSSTVTGLMALDSEQGDLAFGFNLGYKFRTKSADVPDQETGKVPVEPMSSQVIWSAALRYDLNGAAQSLVSELSGATALGDMVDSSDRGNSSGELTLTYRHLLANQLKVFGGLGTEIIHGPGSAGLRLVAGVSMTMGTTPISASFQRSRNDASDSEAAESSRNEKDAARVVQDEETTVDMESYELPSAKFPTFESNSN